MLKLKLQYFCHLMQRADSLEKSLIPRKTEDRMKEMTEDEMVVWHHRLNGHEFEQTRGDRKPDVLQYMGSQLVAHHQATEQ